MVIGLTVNALGGALRGAVPDLYWLYAMTIVMGAGVAIMQVSLPPAVRTWAPHRIAFATAVYTNGLLIGEIAPVATMLPWVLPLTGTWQWGFAFWSAPVAAIALLLLLAPREARPVAGTAPRRWWPDWGSSLIWRLGIMLGTVNAMYFATNAFLPDFLTSHGEQAWISAALTGLNVGQLPASFLLLAFASRLELRAWPFVASGVLCIVGSAGVVFGSGAVVVAAATLIGFAAACVLVLALALPPLLAPADDVHRVTAAMFTISYSCAVVVPVLSGLAWDISGIAGSAFVPIGLCGLVLAVLAPSINHVRRGEN
jgi:CP family cyanate transporter-like MFS transporter